MVPYNSSLLKVAVLTTEVLILMLKANCIQLDTNFRIVVFPEQVGPTIAIPRVLRSSSIKVIQV